jgi:hypothetical protein
LPSWLSEELEFFSSIILTRIVEKVFGETGFPCAIVPCTSNFPGKFLNGHGLKSPEFTLPATLNYDNAARNAYPLLLPHDIHNKTRMENFLGSFFEGQNQALSTHTGKDKKKSNISLERQRMGGYLPESWRCDETNRRWIPITNRGNDQEDGIGYL